LLSTKPSRKTGGKTVNTVYIKKALAKSLAWTVVPGLLSVLGQLTKKPHCCLCPIAPYSKMHQDDPPPTLFIGYHLSELFSLSKSEVRAGWHLAVPG
jgi:hypothetical protein